MIYPGMNEYSTNNNFRLTSILNPVILTFIPAAVTMSYQDLRLNIPLFLTVFNTRYEEVIIIITAVISFILRKSKVVIIEISAVLPLL